MNNQKKNYLEHKVKVKILDAIFSKEQEWNWFFQFLEDNFDLDDVNSWDQFKRKQTQLADVLLMTIKIVEICPEVVPSADTLLTDMTMIAKMYLERCSFEECNSAIKSQFGKLLSLIVWMTKLENRENGSNYLTNTGIIVEHNYWALKKLDALFDCQNELLQAANEINVTGWENRKNCLKANLNQINYDWSEDYFEMHHNELVNVNAFSYQVIEIKNDQTWEEVYLLEMLKTCLKDGKLHPLMAIKGIDVPEIDNWIPERLQRMREFFQHPDADFIIETVAFILRGEQPSFDTALKHCELLDECYKTSELNEFIHSSSLNVVSLLFANKYFEPLKQEEAYRRLLDDIHSIDNPQTIQQLKSLSLPISSKQKEIIEDYVRNQYKEIEKINSLQDFVHLIRIPEIPEHIDRPYLDLVHDTFLNLVEMDNNAYVSTAFYYYMVFLFEVSKRNHSIDRVDLQQTMIETQRIWQEEFYEKQTELLQPIQYGAQIPNEEVERLNTLAKEHPFFIAINTMLVDDDSFLKALETMSEYPISSLFTTTILTPIFPEIIHKDIDYRKHEVDALLDERLSIIVDEKGYRLLNVLDNENYIRGILDRYRFNVTSYLGLIDSFGLYEKVKETNELIEMNDEVRLAHITQLFPLLEIKIRQLAQLLGYFPFKQELDNFMAYKDPSSLLRRMIRDAYAETGEFKIIPDLLFVYNCLYNSNSLNIRNECVHGRDYLSGAKLHLGLKVCLLSILMLEFRTKTIRDEIDEAFAIPDENGFGIDKYR